MAFDLLAEPGKDVRDLPLRDRWDMLSVALAGARPPLQQVMATTSRTEAPAWYRDLEPLGIEGIVARGWDTPYTPGPATGRGPWKGRSGRRLNQCRRTRVLRVGDGTLPLVAGAG